MNPDQPSREQIETRLTALLLGELPSGEAALLRYTMAQDPELQKLHDELESTLALVREAAKTPANAPMEKAALKLSADRRAKLLTHFKTPRPKPEPLFWLKPIVKVPRLVEVLVVVAVLAVLAAMLLPALSKSKSRAMNVAALSEARQKALQYQLKAEEKGDSMSLGSAPHGTHVAGKLASSDLKLRTWSGDNADRYPQQVATASGTPQPVTVTLAPEPQLAPPPAAPPVQIVLPQTEPPAQLANNSTPLKLSGGNGQFQYEDMLSHRSETAGGVVTASALSPSSSVSFGSESGPVVLSDNAPRIGGTETASWTLGATLKGHYDDTVKPQPTPAPTAGADHFRGLLANSTPQTASETPPATAAVNETPAKARKGNVFSQEIVGYVNVPTDAKMVPNSLPAGAGVNRVALADGDSDGVSRQARVEQLEKKSVSPSQGLGIAANEVAHNSDTQERMAHVERQWILPKTAPASPNSTPSPSRNNGPVVGIVNAFAGSGGFRNTGGAGGGGGGGAAGGYSISGAAAGFDKDIGERFEAPKRPGESGILGLAGTAGAPANTPSDLALNWDNSSVDRSRAKDAENQPARFGGGFSFGGPGQPTAAIGTPVTKMAPPTFDAMTGLPSGTAAANTFYRELKEEPKQQTPLLGDVPAAGSLFQHQPSDSFTTGLAKSDAEGLRDLTAKSAPEPATLSAPENHSPFVAGYAFVTTNAIALNDGRLPTTPSTVSGEQQGVDLTKQIQIAQQKVEARRQDLGITDTLSTEPIPTLDAVQLQTINQQRVEGEKIYNEGLVQLQELKSLEKSDKGKLAEILPQVVQDKTLAALLSKRKQVAQQLAAMKNEETSQTRDESAKYFINELDHQIDDRTAGIMAGLESQLNSKKAALDALTTSVENAKRTDQATALKDEPYYEAKRELQQKLEMHRLLGSKLVAEKLDSSLPKTSMVQITDPAEPATNQTTWQRLTGQYASTARVKVENDVNDISGLNNTPTAGYYDPYFIQTTFEAMQSTAVLSNVVTALNLDSKWAKNSDGEKLTKSEAIAQLKKRLDLQPVPNTKLISIGAKSSDPQEAADIANAVAKAYGQYRIESRRALATNGVAVLEEQFQQQTEDIKTNQAYIEQLRQRLLINNEPEPTTQAPEKVDLPIRKPAPNTPLPQPEILTSSNAFSTFSLNVSDVSFKFAEASLQNGKLPDTASVRSEEFINAFDYRDPEAAAGQPMAFASERARYPFAQNRELLRFSIKTAAAGRQAGRALNLVLLLDNSGSMERADRVAIIREALRVLATQLQPQDTVSIVTFSRTARLWADGVSGAQAAETLDKVGGITPEGGTNLEEAMRLAYETARRHYLPTGLNRVVLLTDGAANLGNVDPTALKEKVEAQRKQGIALDCFGIGWEDLNDDLLEQLSSNGDGRYAFLNSPEEASTEFAAKLAGALQIAAADVKVQVEFNPRRVISYRQIGYAKHQLTKEQFRDNTVDAAEIAAQEAGNALYTIETNPNGDGPVATVRVRYKIPGTADYRERSWDVPYTGDAPALDQSSPAMRLAATASAFSEWLAASPYAQEVTLDELLRDLSGVPEIYGADARPKRLETMLREAKSLEGK